ncbi:hypothetical protein MTYM_02408 [Methylococcales bacterium]|nr:hypothetical protein MTYM_02408 [Methylococcales bacterium]
MSITLLEVKRNPLPTVMVITNSEPLSISLINAARLASNPELSAYAITYSESLTFLTPRRVEEIDFFILELFRLYPGGQRAEGLVLADRWKYRKSFLIVAPLYVSHQIRCPGYWDAAAEDSLVERIHHIMSFPERCLQGFEKLQERFSQMRNLPPQH